MNAEIIQAIRDHFRNDFTTDIRTTIVDDNGYEENALLTVRENIDGGIDAMYAIDLVVLDEHGNEIDQGGTMLFSKGQLAALAAQIVQVLP